MSNSEDLVVVDSEGLEGIETMNTEGKFRTLTNDERQDT